MAVLMRGWLLIPTIVVLAGCRTGQEQWGPFRGQVVDAETGRPIAGAHVMVLWIREPPSLHFTQSFYDAQETVTDADGGFELPRETRLLTAFVREPGVTVFVPGYLMQAPEVTPAGGRAYVEPTVVTMRPLKTREGQCEGVRLWSGPLLDVGSNVPTFMAAVRQYVSDLDCRWPGGR